MLRPRWHLKTAVTPHSTMKTHQTCHSTMYMLAKISGRPSTTAWPSVRPQFHDNSSATAATRLKVTGSLCRLTVGGDHRFVRDVALFLRPAVAATFVFAFCAACLFPALPCSVFYFKQQHQHHISTQSRAASASICLTTEKFCTGNDLITSVYSVSQKK